MAACQQKQLKTNTRWTPLIAALLCAFLALPALFGQTASSNETASYGALNPDETIPFMPKARTGTLDNGLTYYVLQNAMPKGRAYIRLAVKAGSILEEENERGLAHFVEHMAFNGTKRFPESALIDYMRSLGMRFGADLNAYTSFEETVYMIETPTETDQSGKKVIPQKALDIFDDWTYAISFAEKDVDEERSVIMEEKRTRSGVQSRLQDVYYPLLFADSRYASRLPIGDVEVITGAPAERLKGFYEKWYRPENMAIIIAGDFDADNLVQNLNAYFNAPKSEEIHTLPVFSLPPPQDGDLRIKVWTDSELTSTQVNIHYKQKWEEPENTVKTYRKKLLDSLIAVMMNERFGLRGLEPDAPFTGASGDISRVTNTSEFYILGAGAKDGRLRETINALLAEKETALRYGFVNSELERAKKSIYSAYERFYNESDKRSSSNYVNEFSEHYLRNIEAPGIEWEFNAVKELMEGINAGDVNSRVKEYFTAGDTFVFVLAPLAGSGELPDEAEIEQMLQNAPRLALKEPEETAVSGSLIDETPVKGAIVKEKNDKPSGAKALVLSNGARVILRPTDNKDDDITMYAMAKGGTANVPDEDVISARMAADIAAGSGVGGWQLKDLIKKLAGKQVSLAFLPSSFVRAFSGNSTRADIGTLFELLYLRFTAPRLDNDALNIVKDNWLVQLKTRHEQPDNVFQDTLTTLLYNNDPRFNPFTVDDIQKIDISKARDFIESALNPADWTFVFAGNIDEAVIKPLIETYLASIPVPSKTVYRLSGYPEKGIIRPEAQTREVFKGKEERGMVYISRIIPTKFDMQTSLAADVLSDYIEIVLTEQIREKRGGVYSIYAGVELSPLPPRKSADVKGAKGGELGELSIEIHFICDPKRVDELCAAINEVFDDIVAGKVNADTYAKARYAQIRGLESSLQYNRYIANTLAKFTVVYNLEMKTVFQRDKMYERVTLKDIQTILKRLLRESGEVKAVLYPEK